MKTIINMLKSYFYVFKKHIWETLRKDTLFTRSDKDQTLEDIKSDAGRR